VSRMVLVRNRDQSWPAAAPIGRAALIWLHYLQGKPIQPEAAGWFRSDPKRPEADLGAGMPA
jgi:hypothetical protein